MSHLRLCCITPTWCPYYNDFTSTGRRLVLRQVAGLFFGSEHLGTVGAFEWLFEPPEEIPSAAEASAADASESKAKTVRRRTGTRTEETQVTKATHVASLDGSVASHG